MAQYSKRKVTSAPNHTTPRPNKLTIQETSQPEAATTLTPNQRNTMGKNSQHSSVSNSQTTKGWIQKTINSERRSTASPNQFSETRQTTTPARNDEESELQQQINTSLLNDEQLPDNEQQEPPPTQATAAASQQEEESLDVNNGSLSASIYDLQSFVDRLPRELLHAFEQEKFTKPISLML
jgi:hypothetical protein